MDKLAKYRKGVEFARQENASLVGMAEEPVVPSDCKFSDDFTKGIQTLRCGMRVAFVGYRPEAYCQVTGI